MTQPKSSDPPPFPPPPKINSKRSLSLNNYLIVNLEIFRTSFFGFGDFVDAKIRTIKRKKNSIKKF